VLDQSNNDGHDRCGKENLINYIVKVLSNQFPNRLNVRWLELVWSIIVDSIFDSISLNTFLKVTFKFFGERIYSSEIFNDHSRAYNHLIIFVVLMVIVKDYNFT
jgi:hypothetical protein